jgi:hypothetical protein
MTINNKKGRSNMESKGAAQRGKTGSVSRERRQAQVPSALSDAQQGDSQELPQGTEARATAVVDHQSVAQSAPAAGTAVDQGRARARLRGAGPKDAPTSSTTGGKRSRGGNQDTSNAGRDH